MQKDGMKADGIDDDDDIAMKDGTADVLGGAERENQDDEDEDVYVRIRFLPERVFDTSALLTLKFSLADADSAPLRRTCFGRCKPHGSDHRQFPASEVNFRPRWTLLSLFSLSDDDQLLQGCESGQDERRRCRRRIPRRARSSRFRFARDTSPARMAGFRHPAHHAVSLHGECPRIYLRAGISLLTAIGQMATLADPKTSHENTALKGLSLDHIGNVIAHIRSLTSEKAASLSSLSQVSQLLAPRPSVHAAYD
jgi:hypothetical protein